MSDLKTAALEYHANPRPGKLSVELTKATATARDLSLAYSPGVAEPVREIARDPELAYKYTGKGNLVAVISDGTAILGILEAVRLLGLDCKIYQAGTSEMFGNGSTLATSSAGKTCAASSANVGRRACALLSALRFYSWLYSWFMCTSFTTLVNVVHYLWNVVHYPW